jgi:prepilin-type N-terminal cleavage/methylation domain-containing protein
MQALPNATARALPAAGRPARRGFTLTELLVVIAIIAVLAAMGSWGVMQAMGTAKQTRIKVEVDQLDAAIKAYRERYGSYPPARFTGFVAHLARAFPRYNTMDFRADWTAAGMELNAFRPDQALVFWLSGFSPDPQHPFVTPGDPTNPAAPVKGAQIIAGMVPNPTQKVASAPLYDFDVTRLAAVPSTLISPSAKPNGVVPSYFPQGTKMDQVPSTGAPYVYWDSQGYAQLASPIVEPLANLIMFNESVSPFTAQVFPSAGLLLNYAFDADGDGLFDNQDTWANPDSFQIISAGPDGKYGAPARLSRVRLFPTGGGYDPAGADDDNVTNFNSKARIGDAKP